MSLNERTWQPDWTRIQSGTPFTSKDLDEKHLTNLKPPLAVKSRAEAEKLCEQYGVALYPTGEYELRCDARGQLWLMHTEWYARAGMWQFQTETDSAINKFNREVFDDPRVKG